MNFLVLWIVGIMFFVGVQVFTAVLVYRDAQEKKLAAEGWMALNVFLPLIGILIYFVLHPRTKYPIRSDTSNKSKVTDGELRRIMPKYALPDAPRAHLLKFADGRLRMLASEEETIDWLNDQSKENPVEVWEMRQRTMVSGSGKV